MDYPYVSDFLKETILKNNFPVIKTKQASDLLANNAINWIAEDNAISKLKENPNTKLYTNSENSIDWVFKHLKESNKAKWIQIFKDKYAFRELIKDIYPDFFFAKISLETVNTIDISTLPFPFVIKPAIGFFSLGVHIVHNLEDWNRVKSALKPEKLKHIFPDNVIDTSYFIIEEYIQGNEYAVDCYFNEKGEAVIQNILFHKFASDTDVSDRVYYTSKEILDSYHDKLTEFLHKIGKKMQLKNFPIHIEVKINKKGTIIPIEVNPMRFGGWCTTADLTWFAYQFNPYVNYMENISPNWKNILKDRVGYKYAVLILSPVSEIKKTENVSFNYNKLKLNFENVLHIRKIDFSRFSFFGFAFIATKDETEINAFLQSDLSEYLVFD